MLLQCFKSQYSQGWRVASDWLLLHLHHKPTRHNNQSQQAGIRVDQSESESAGEYLMLYLHCVILPCFSKMFCRGPQLMIVELFRVGPTALLPSPPTQCTAHMVLHNTNILGGRILLILCNINSNIMCTQTQGPGGRQY